MPEPAQQKIAYLDGVRGLAILLVLFHHTLMVFTGIRPQGNAETFLFNAGRYAEVGVDLFFILSGFLITGILLRSKGRPSYYKNFFIRRTLRIFPLYYLYLVFSFFVIPAFPSLFGQLNLAAGTEPWYWFYLSNFKMFFDRGIPSYYVSHTWSLAIEEQFYLVWPFIVAFCSTRVLKIFMPLVILASLAVRLTLDHAGADFWQMRIFTFGRLDTLAAGAWLALLYRDNFFSSLPRSSLATGTAAGSLLLALMFLLSNLFPACAESFFYSKALLIFSGILILLFISPANSLPRRIFESKLLCAFGKYSYSIYICHMAVGIQLFWRALPWMKAQLVSPFLIWPVFFVVFSLFSFLVAFMTYHCFEVFFLKLKPVLAPSRK